MRHVYCSRYSCDEPAEVRVTCPATRQDYVLCSGHRAQVRTELRDRFGDSAAIHETPLIEHLQEVV
ncbi:hypothetical protein AB0I72_19460 [Nocardiopsis sp. NPDC049922]|uniref:hypothetical protein n=1 Tax=Nocardiopsis sp. NPDC049922 TaxID=3155157 RepID=UPI0033D69165